MMMTVLTTIPTTTAAVVVALAVVVITAALVLALPRVVCRCLWMAMLWKWHCWTLLMQLLF